MNIKITGSLHHKPSGREVPFNVFLDGTGRAAEWHGQVNPRPGHWHALGRGVVQGKDEDALRVAALGDFKTVLEATDLDEPGAT